jgi:peptide-methionine (S)-S-oxide reductase
MLANFLQSRAFLLIQIKSSFHTILDIFFHTHDPTTLNRQGADTGTQYRSAIFYHNETQREIAEKLKEELDNSGKFEDPIVTEITPFTAFYEAEEYHRDFYERNRTAPYCRIVIDPKMQKLLKQYRLNINEDEIR